MKLTNAMRDTFVRHVMQDVPEIDYQAELQKVAEAHVCEKLPKEITKIFKNASLKGFIAISNMSFRSQSGRYLSANIPIYSDYSSVKSDLLLLPEFADLLTKHDKQTETRISLKYKVEQSIQSVSTVKQALELMPAFAKYLPKQGETISKLTPAVIANLAADLSASGWPKDAKKSGSNAK